MMPNPRLLRSPPDGARRDRGGLRARRVERGGAPPGGRLGFLAAACCQL